MNDFISADALQQVLDLHGMQMVSIADPRNPTPEAAPASVPAAILPKGMELKNIKPILDAYRQAPERREGQYIALDLDSLITHINRFAMAQTAVFCDSRWQAGTTPTNWQLPSITAVYDYHHGAAHTGQDGPGWRKHTARYSFPLSDPFMAWLGSNNASMSTGEFAVHVEGNILDIGPAPIITDAEPETDFDRMIQRMTRLLTGKWAEAIDLMGLARTIKINESNKAEIKTDLKGGAGKILWQTEHQTDSGETFAPPDLFMLQIPIFKGGASFGLPCRLRYRVSGGSVKWSYEIYRADIAFELALREACAKVAEQTKLPLLMGIPE